MLMEHIEPIHARDRAINLYGDEFESGPTQLVRSRGRINIIGDHVDHEGGLVLPIAIDLATYLAFTPRADQRIRMRSEGQSSADFLLGHRPEPKGR
jgi:galactokinase